MKTIVTGAGLSGLAAGWALKENVLILEASNRVGGLSRTCRFGNFGYDLGPHVLYFRNPKVKDWAENILDGKWKRMKRKAVICIDGEMVNYPIQEGFMASNKLKDMFLPDLLKASQKRVAGFRITAENLYGHSIAHSFFIPYNTKLWLHDLDEIDETACTKYLPSFPVKDLQRLEKGEFLPRGANAFFYYPESKGIGGLSEAILRKSKAPVYLGERVQRICLEEKWVETGNKKRYRYSRLIATIPLPELTGITMDIPDRLRDAARKLKSVGMLFVYLRTSIPLSNYHWIYYPDPELIFHRISIPASFADDMNPQDKGSLVAEISFKTGENPDIQSLIDMTKKQVVSLGIVENADQIVSDDYRIADYAYVFQTTEGEKARLKLRNYYRQKGVITAGRYAMWEYGNMESAIQQGLEAGGMKC